jgi:hypothetical protein
MDLFATIVTVLAEQLFLLTAYIGLLVTVYCGK